MDYDKLKEIIKELAGKKLARYVPTWYESQPIVGFNVGVYLFWILMECIIRL